jgi:transcriptional regulator with XRE-family HTH domain
MGSHVGRHSARTNDNTDLDDYRTLAFGPVFRRWREMREIGVEAIADRVGLSPEEVRMVEASEIFPDLPILFRLASAVSGDLAELVHETRPVGLGRMNTGEWFGTSDHAMAS